MRFLRPLSPSSHGPRFQRESYTLFPHTRCSVQVLPCGVTKDFVQCLSMKSIVAIIITSLLLTSCQKMDSVLAGTCMTFATIFSPDYYISSSVPANVVIKGRDNRELRGKENLTDRKIIVSFIEHSPTRGCFYALPETAESKQLFNEWWEHAQNMGTWSGLLATPFNEGVCLYFSDGLYVSFGKNDVYYGWCSETSVYPNEFEDNEFYSRPLNKYDVKLKAYLIKNMENPNLLLSEEEKEQVFWIPSL